MNTEQVLVQTGDQIELLLRQLEASEVVGYDAETSGVDWRKNHIVGHVIKPVGCPSYYVPVRHHGGGNIDGCRIPQTEEGWRGDLHPFEVAFAKIAAAKPRRWFGHNFGFDLKFAYRHGLHFYGEYEDTMVNAALLDENMRGFSLENVAVWCDAVQKKGTELYQYLSESFGGPAERSSMKHFWRSDASKPVVWDYASGDGISTEDVWRKQNQFIIEEELTKVHGVENRLVRTLFRITRSGIRIDEQELDRVDALFKSKAEELKRKLPKDFNPKSPLQMKAFLDHRIKEIGEDWPRTPKGALQFNEAILKTIPEGRDILDVRKLEHAVSSFTGPMKERHLHNGRVFCEFNQMKADEFGTVSGRLSSSNPNLQQVPKRDKFIGKEYRRCFLPDPDHIWEDRDYKQQEYVVFTDYTRDPILMEGYMADPPVDIHQSVADMIHVERDPTAKRMNLGMLYGMGVAKLAESLGVSEHQAREWMKMYHEKFPAAKGFLKSAENRARQRGFVFTYLGRKRRFPDSRFAHKAGNGVIQGSSADITKAKMVEIDEYFESEGDINRLLLQCHDSLSWSAPKTEAGKRMSDEADRIMQDFSSEGAIIKMGVPLRIDMSSGDNWSQATFGP